LAVQAIDAFAESNAEGGLQQGAYPSRSDNVIATFFAGLGRHVERLVRWSSPVPR